MMAVACLRAVAGFVLEGEHQAPARLDLINTSEAASSYAWYLDGKLISDRTDTSLILYSSGRYELSLVAEEGSKSDSYTKEIFIDAPKVCVVLIKTTMGDMAFSLSELTPKHQRNFLKRVQLFQMMIL